jgi:ABC-type transport system involved in multi-copper enzyme maturation permease subunit
LGRLGRQALGWTGALGGLFVLMHWALPAVLPAEATGTLAATIEQTAAQFTELAAIVTAVGVVLLTAGLIVDERRNGVLEWLLSKPLARPALVTAKFAGNGAGLLVATIAAPWAAVYLLLSVAAGGPWSAPRLLGTAGMVGLLAVFHLALVLAMSTVTSGRVAVLAVPLVMIVSADLVTAAVPRAFDLLPWSLARVAGAHLAEGVLVSGWPIVATVVWTSLLLAVAAGKLARTEL